MWDTGSDAERQAERTRQERVENHGIRFFERLERNPALSGILLPVYRQMSEARNILRSLQAACNHERIAEAPCIMNSKARARECLICGETDLMYPRDETDAPWDRHGQAFTTLADAPGRQVTRYKNEANLPKAIPDFIGV